MTVKLNNEEKKTQIKWNNTTFSNIAARQNWEIAFKSSPIFFQTYLNKSASTKYYTINSITVSSVLNVTKIIQSIFKNTSTKTLIKQWVDSTGTPISEKDKHQWKTKIQEYPPKSLEHQDGMQMLASKHGRKMKTWSYMESGLQIYCSYPGVSP